MMYNLHFYHNFCLLIYLFSTSFIKWIHFSIHSCILSFFFQNVVLYGKKQSFYCLIMFTMSSCLLQYQMQDSLQSGSLISTSSHVMLCTLISVLLHYSTMSILLGAMACFWLSMRRWDQLLQLKNWLITTYVYIVLFYIFVNHFLYSVHP